MNENDINSQGDTAIGGDVVGRDTVTNIFMRAAASATVLGDQLAAKKCFVIMPFSGTTDEHTEEYWTSFFQDFIKPSVEGLDLGYLCERSVARPAHIIKDILAQLRDCDIVLAVLTDYNPNVWYELGVRHSFRNGTIMIIEKGSKVPFDIQEYGVIQYQDNLPGRTDFERQLRAFIIAIENSRKTDSPVMDFLNEQPVKRALVAPDARHSPLIFLSALSLARQKLMVVGQNLHSLTRSEFRDAAFDALAVKAIDLQLLLCDQSPSYVPKAIRDFTHNDFIKDLESSLQQFLQWQEHADEERKANRLKGRLEIRITKRIGNFSLTFVDPELDSGMLEITPVPYESQSAARARFILSRKEHSDLFQAYWSAYDTIYRVRGSRSIREMRSDWKSKTGNLD